MHHHGGIKSMKLKYTISSKTNCHLYFYKKILGKTESSGIKCKEDRSNFKYLVIIIISALFSTYVRLEAILSLIYTSVFIKYEYFNYQRRGIRLL
jgi:hypothetical protein